MVWRESEEEKTCPQAVLIFSDVLDFVCRYVLALK